MAIPKFLEKMRNSIQTSGGTMTGDLILSADPDQNLEAATKQYVDNKGGAFFAIYESTSWQEVKEAYEKGKTIWCIYENYFCPFTEAFLQTSTEDFYFKVLHRGQEIDRECYINLNSNNEWSYSDGPSNNYFSQPVRSYSNIPITKAHSYYRPILISTSAPTASDGNVGDVWIQYSE